MHFIRNTVMWVIFGLLTIVGIMPYVSVLNYFWIGIFHSDFMSSMLTRFHGIASPVDCLFSGGQCPSSINFVVQYILFVHVAYATALHSFLALFAESDACLIDCRFHTIRSLHGTPTCCAVRPSSILTT